MTALRLAAQQALEALERSRHWSPLYRGSIGVISAIAALRAALKQEEEASAWLAERKEYWRKEKEKIQATNALRAALEQQDEPVATLTAQRDALLEVLKLARSIIGHPDDAHSRLIDAAIKAVEVGK